MHDTALQRSRFGQRLRAELDRRRMSIRALARVLDPQRPDVARRNLARWIGGYNQPTRIHRIAVAEALGLPPDSFLEDDDEEADPMFDLVEAIRRVVRDETRTAALQTLIDGHGSNTARQSNDPINGRTT